MIRYKVISSNILTIGYDDSTNTLEIEMRDLHVYQYNDVPISIYNGIMEAESKGKYLAEHVKGRYGYMRVGNYSNKIREEILEEEIK